MPTKTYERQPYSVTVDAEGKIKVKSGDWLSKYSWAIYGNYTTLNVFARWDDRQGKIKEYPIANKDLITAGETIIHYPTYEQYKKGAVVTAQASPTIQAPALNPLPQTSSL